MSEIIYPTTVLPSDKSVPLYAAFGLTSKESDTVYFGVSEILASKKTVAEALIMIRDNPKWNASMKVWGAFNLNKELFRAKVPAGFKGLIDRI